MTEAVHPLLKDRGLLVRGLELEPAHDRGQHHPVPVRGGVRGQLQEQLVGVGKRAVCSEAGPDRQRQFRVMDRAADPAHLGRTLVAPAVEIVRPASACRDQQTTGMPEAIAAGRQPQAEKIEDPVAPQASWPHRGLRPGGDDESAPVRRRVRRSAIRRRGFTMKSFS